eukprot:TRINITY_DN90890_c0_g1_i1.p1 TRINITY_DN90890_c0_g1~~TRINITY_DN90890_c0_g1_i1.p1  ORF type:complete len:211 (-),score=61.21 TRINITY_DN90890_c0_g1_i1:21-653(-)
MAKSEEKGIQMSECHDDEYVEEPQDEADAETDMTTGVLDKLVEASSIVLTCILLPALLMAQLKQGQTSFVQDTRGLADLTHATVTLPIEKKKPEKQWWQVLFANIVTDTIELNEADLALMHGVSVLEPPNAYQTTVDAMRAWDGTTSPAMAWKAADEDDVEDGYKFESLEKLVVRGTKVTGMERQSSSTSGAPGSSFGSESSSETGAWLQ